MNCLCQAIIKKSIVHLLQIFRAWVLGLTIIRYALKGDKVADDITDVRDRDY